MTDPNATSHAGQHGGIEVFYLDTTEHEPDDPDPHADAGWYWWACQPGCLPDGEPVGPFDTSEEACLDALPLLP